jgi:hypothetical protein
MSPLFFFPFHVVHARQGVMGLQQTVATNPKVRLIISMQPPSVAGRLRILSRFVDVSLERCFSLAEGSPEGDGGEADATMDRSSWHGTSRSSSGSVSTRVAAQEKEISGFDRP